MRALSTITIGLLMVGMTAEGAYIIKTRRQIADLETRITELAGERDGDMMPRAFGPPAERDRPALPTAAAPDAPAGRLPPPRFVVQPPSGAPTGAPNPAPLPPGLDTPEARQQLSQFVAAELQRTRDEERDRMRQRRDEWEKRRMDETIKSLGLNADEARRFGDMVASTDSARQAIRQKFQDGNVPRDQVMAEMRALREKTEADMKSLLGEERYTKYRELQRGERGGRGGGGPGGPFGGGGPPGQGGPPAP